MKENAKKKEFLPSWGAILVCFPFTLVMFFICYLAMDEILVDWLSQHFNPFIGTLIYCIFLGLLLWGTMWFFRITSKRDTEIEEKRKKEKQEQ